MGRARPVCSTVAAPRTGGGKPMDAAGTDRMHHRLRLYRRQRPDNRASRGRSHRSAAPTGAGRSEEHTSELQSLMRTSYAVLCLKKKNQQDQTINNDNTT